LLAPAIAFDAGCGWIPRHAIAFWENTRCPVLPVGSPAVGQQAQILSRFSSWAVVRSGELISLSSDSGNIGVGCSDATKTYITLVKIIDRSSTGSEWQFVQPPWT
jgi:hypothetical protein